MDDAEIAAELQSIQASLARIADALAARGAPADGPQLERAARVATDELDSLSNEELRRLAQDPE
jgi:hypothetical protein